MESPSPGFPPRAPTTCRWLTSTALGAAVTPRAVAPAEAGPGAAQGQVVLVAHARVGLLAEELGRRVLAEACPPPGPSPSASGGLGAPHLDDQGLGGGAASEEPLRRQVPLGPALVVQDGAGHGQGPGAPDGPVPVEVVLAPHALHRCAGVSDRSAAAEGPAVPPRPRMPQPALTQEIPAGRRLLHADAGGPRGNYEDLVVACGGRDTLRPPTPLAAQSGSGTGKSKQDTGRGVLLGEGSSRRGKQL